MQDESLPAPNGDHFEPWLSSVTTAYKSLNDEKRNFLLEHLIANSEPYQLNFLSTHIPALSCRDFISHLPSEIVTNILKHLSGRQLLKLQQVCKSWRDCIESATDVWQIKALEVGVDVKAISTKYPKYSDRAEVCLASYCLAEVFLSSLKQRRFSTSSVPKIVVSGQGKDTYALFTDDRIIVTNRADDTVMLYSFLPKHFDAKMLTGCQGFTLILQHKYNRLFMANYGGGVVAQSVDLSGGPLHGRSNRLAGHTSAASTADVLESKEEGVHYVITGSMDRTVRVWITRRGERDSELFMTLSNAHNGNVSEVHFLPCENGENGELRFISCGPKNLNMWSLNMQTRALKSCRATVLDFSNDDIASFYFDEAKPEQVFLTQWSFSSKRSALTSYTLSSENVGIDVNRHWKLSVPGFKAAIMGAGSRFALLLCSVSMLDFCLFDLVSGCSKVAFTTCYRFYRLPVKLYNTSWLDGLVFNKEGGSSDDGNPIIIGQTRSNKIEMLKFQIPVLKLKGSAPGSVENSCKEGSIPAIFRDYPAVNG